MVLDDRKLRLTMMKSVNLQYNMLVRWAYGTKYLQPSIWCYKYFFFINSLQKPFQFTTKMKTKSLECPKSISNYGKKNTWNVRRFVDKSFIPSAKRNSVLYCFLWILRWATTFYNSWIFVTLLPTVRYLFQNFGNVCLMMHSG